MLSPTILVLMWPSLLAIKSLLVLPNKIREYCMVFEILNMWNWRKMIWHYVTLKADHTHRTNASGTWYTTCPNLWYTSFFIWFCLSNDKHQDKQKLFLPNYSCEPHFSEHYDPFLLHFFLPKVHSIYFWVYHIWPVSPKEHVYETK